MSKRPAQILILTIILYASTHGYLLGQGSTTINTPKQLSPLEIYIFSLCKEIEEKGKLTDKLSEEDLASLPLGIARQTPAGTFVLAIDSAFSDERGAFLSTYASITLPGTTRPLAFAGKNIAFNPDGFAGSSQAKLLLAAPVSIPLNDHVSMELPADGRNFLEWDCNGFKAINLKGNFVFSNTLLLPDPELTQEPFVTATFEINTGDLNNILLAVNITPFQIRGLTDLSFEVKNATVDLSDLVNPSDFSFPQDYQQSFGENITLWRGFFLNEVAIRIKGFTDEAGGDPTLTARNLLIDDLGVSGLFTASNLLALANGSADGWPISIDEMSVKLMFSKVSGGSLAGNLGIPFLGEEPIPYSAMMEQVGNEVNYRFSITTNGTQEYKTPFSATIRLDKGSVIALEKRDGRFYPSTRLQGALKIDAKLISVSEIKFQDLSLTTRKPYIQGGIFSTVSNGQAKSIGFPIRIDNVKLGIYENEAAIGFKVALNLMNGSDKGFSAETAIRILASVKEEETISSSGTESVSLPKKRQKWEFNKIKVEDIIIGGGKNGTTAIALAGKLSLHDNHPVYGDGFRGSVSLSIRKILDRGVKATVYFGSKETFRYWHVNVKVPTKIPLIAPFQIDGMMGGASYRMVRQQTFVPDFTKIKKDSTNQQENETVFIPDQRAGMSFMVGVTLIATNDKAFNADAILEVAFNQGGGIRYAQFSGNAFFFTAVNNRERTTGGQPPKAPVNALLNMLYDNDNNVFHANIKTYVNLANVISGTGPNGLVGEAVIHADPRDWYIYIGRPSQMFGLTVAKLATVQAYFMVGTQIENIPPPPTEVLEIFDDINSSGQRDELALMGGRGFATGAHFRVGFDSKDKLKPFYIMLAIGAGADIMLRDYGNAYCEGGTGRIGIDGWYASGQAYAFLKGKVGIKVKKKSFDIIDLGAAALLQAKLPNPAWLTGRLGGKYSVMGGLVKGKFNLKFTVGEECELMNQGNELDNIQVIADIKPDVDATEVNVFTAPQVSFNTSIETDFSMSDNTDKLNSYKIRLAEFLITKDGITIPSAIEWNATKDVAVLRTSEILPPQSKLKATVKIYWEKKNERGIWEPIKENGQTDYEIKEAIFTTGAAPDFIPDENVKFSYPIKQQYNLHINETGTGYIQLNSGQKYLFEDQWNYIARFEDAQGKTIDVTFNYDVSSRRVTFAIPQELQRQTIYKFFLLKSPLAAGPIDQNVNRTEVAVNAGSDNETTLASNKLDGTIVQDVEKVLYSSAFRTSQFLTFADKWNTFSSTEDLFDISVGYVAVIGKRGNLQESFDQFEVSKTEGSTKSLVQASASAETPWMQTLAPLLYDSYPIEGTISLTWRDPSVLGVKPLRGIKLIQPTVSSYKLEENEISSGVASSKSGPITIGYFLSIYGFRDYSELQSKVVAKYLSNWNSISPAARRLLSSTGYPDLTAGQYPVEITYNLPGTNTITFRKELTIKF